MRRLLPIPLLSLLSLLSGAQSSITTLHGGAGQQLGRSMCEAGDVNGDGYMDVLVGMPNDSGLALDGGGIRILSGRYLATGQGWGLLQAYSSSRAGARLGMSVAYLGTATVNGSLGHYYAVGAPGNDQGGTDAGAVFVLRSGSSAPVGRVDGQPFDELGWSVAAVRNFAGSSPAPQLLDIAAGAPEAISNGGHFGRVYVFRGDYFLTGLGTKVLDQRDGPSPPAAHSTNSYFGTSVSSDGRAVLVGAPGHDVPGSISNEGAVFRFEYAVAMQPIAFGIAASDGLGTSLSRTMDLRGDGKPELLVGASGSSANGAWSGRAVLLEKTASGPWTPLASWSGASADDRFGFSVGIPGDLNADGVADLVVGAIGVEVGSPFSINTGAVYLYSGETLQQMGRYIGPLLSAVGGAIGELADLDQDGLAEFVVGSPFSDVNGTDSGTVISLSPYPMPPSAYCTAKVNSQGCVPAMSWVGTASASDPGPFTVRATKVLNNKPGLMIYGTKPASIPFQGGTLCVGSPVKRSPPAQSGGSSGTNDCSGVLSLDFNAVVQAGTNPDLVPGQEVFAQFWYRDPAASGGSGLSNGLRFVVNP